MATSAGRLSRLVALAVSVERVFASPDCGKCCADAWLSNGNRSAPCSQGCYNCACNDGSSLCGCAHCGGWADLKETEAVPAVAAHPATAQARSRYVYTKGNCRGGTHWPSGSLWDCIWKSQGSMTTAMCKAQCDATDGCEAFDTNSPTADSLGTCCLFKAGNKGNGASGQWCYAREETTTTTMKAMLRCQGCGIQYGDRFIQLGDWRFGDVDGSHASIAHKDGKTAQIFRKDGTLHRGPRNDFTTWDRPVGDPSNISFGDRFIQIGEWRFGAFDASHASIAHKDGKTAQIFKKGGTSGGDRSDFRKGYFNTWDRPVGYPSQVYFGDRFIQFGEWRFGDVDGSHASVAHQDGKTAQIFRKDGTLHKGPRKDFSTWSRPAGDPSKISFMPSSRATEVSTNKKSQMRVNGWAKRSRTCSHAFQGNKGRYSKVGTVLECQRVCDRDVQCKGFSFRKADKTCFFFVTKACGAGSALAGDTTCSEDWCNYDKSEVASCRFQWEAPRGFGYFTGPWTGQCKSDANGRACPVSRVAQDSDGSYIAGFQHGKYWKMAKFSSSGATMPRTARYYEGIPHSSEEMALEYSTASLASNAYQFVAGDSFSCAQAQVTEDRKPEVDLAQARADTAAAELKLQAQEQIARLEVDLEKAKEEAQAAKIRFNQQAARVKLEVELEKVKAEMNARDQIAEAVSGGSCSADKEAAASEASDWKLKPQQGPGQQHEFLLLLGAVINVAVFAALVVLLVLGARHFQAAQKGSAEMQRLRLELESLKASLPQLKEEADMPKVLSSAASDASVTSDLASDASSFQLVGPSSVELDEEEEQL
eukprot:TRINITY_DN11741_c0_g1_i4.p1 TRINITY_DN11741_c0_g1~~TRINITY_DN11741_c0_g1_i4.p1  ORF type:complete len:829 (-),score=157.69 TRINITY_DN11741_c0_g1_i4:75-2528(-)